MYLVMTKEKPESWDIEAVVKGLNAQFAVHSYVGESTKRIKENLLKELPNSVVVTADSRLLMFGHDIFLLDNIYIYENEKLVPIRETTQKELRYAHNLMKMYEAGTFSLD